MSVSDHTASFLDNIPIFGLAIALAILLVLFERTVHFRKSDLENLKDNESLILETEGFVYVVVSSSWKQIIIFTFLFVFMWIALDATIFLFFLLFHEYWKKISNPISRNLRQLSFGATVAYFHFIPILLAMAVTWGVLFARSDLQRSSGDLSLQFATGEKIENIVLLRSTQTGLLFRDPTRENIIFANWSTINKINAPSIYPSDSRLCRWFQICWIEDNLEKWRTDRARIGRPE